VVTLSYTYSGSRGLPIFVGGLPTVGGAQSPAFGYVPAHIDAAGAGTISYNLSAMDGDCLSTDGIQVYLYDSGGNLIVARDTAMPLSWGACAPAVVGLPTIALSIDRGCGGAYAIGDAISISITPSETVTAAILDFQTDGTQKLISVGTIPAGTTRVVHGTITGPAGTEGIVVRAETAAGMRISAGCTATIGGAAVGAVSVSVDRGCGGSYHDGESATAIVQSTVAGLARLYQVTRTGTVSLVAILPVFPGVTERVTAPLGSTVGTSTFVLQVTGTTGQLHAATCSYSLVP